MKTPFTTDQFLAVFRQYNEAVFPMQVVFYLLGAGTIYLAIKPNRKSGKIISGMLSFFWLWMGLVYHIAYFSDINKAAYLFGFVFIIQGIMIAILGIFRGRLSFKLTADKYGITGISLILFALLIYPTAGCFFGHVYPLAPTFGLPCPTTIFTFGFFLLTVSQFPRALLVIPFAWSIVGFFAVLSFGMVEDAGLLLSALLAVSLLLTRQNQHPSLPDPTRTASSDGPSTPAEGAIKRLVRFVALAFAWSWGCWLLAPVVKGQASWLASALMFLGGFGPTLAAVVLVGWAGGWAGLRGWLARCLRWRVGWDWVALAAGLPLGVIVLAATVHLALGGTLPPSPVWGHGLLAALNFVLILVLGGPLGEEFGWRGYALPALQERYGWRVSSLVLGVVWGCWHLPLFFLANTSQRHIPIALFLGSTLALSVLFAWLANRTAGSLVVVVLFHTAINYWSWVVPVIPTGGSLRPFALVMGLMGLLALGLLVRRTEPPRSVVMTEPVSSSTEMTKLWWIKVLHTAIWVFFVAAIGYVFYSGAADRITASTWLAGGLVVGEGLVLLMFKNQCPLTVLARRYSASRADNFDIFLPNWLARYNKPIFTAIYLAGMLLVGYRLIR